MSEKICQLCSIRGCSKLYSEIGAEHDSFNLIVTVMLPLANLIYKNTTLCMCSNCLDLISKFNNFLKNSEENLKKCQNTEYETIKVHSCKENIYATDTNPKLKAELETPNGLISIIKLEEYTLTDNDLKSNQDVVLDTFSRQTEDSLNNETQFAIENSCRGAQNQHTNDSHSNDVHNNTSEKTYKCQTCNQAYKTRRGLTDHIRNRKHQKPYKCQTCNKDFLKPWDLKVHMQSHTGEKPYNCEACSKTFARAEYLIKHMRTHKKYECSNCFKTVSNLTAHMLSHTGDMPYKCKTCDKAFKRPSSIKVHMGVHTCELCILSATKHLGLNNI